MVLVYLQPLITVYGCRSLELGPLMAHLGTFVTNALVNTSIVEQIETFLYMFKSVRH